MQAQEVARRISGVVAGESTQKVNIPSTHHNPYLSHYIICHVPPVFLSPQFTLVVLFALSLSLSLSSLSICLFLPACLLFARVLVCLLVVMSEIGEVIANMDDNNIMENSDAPTKEPTIFHTKKFCVGSGNIIGKGVIQDFFTCAGALPSMGGSILHRTSSLADAIAMLVVELERQFMHMHPCIQRIFLEISNIEHSSVKRAATIFLAHEFRFIIKEAKKSLHIIGWTLAVGVLE